MDEENCRFAGRTGEVEMTTNTALTEAGEGLRLNRYLILSSVALDSVEILDQITNLATGSYNKLILTVLSKGAVTVASLRPNDLENVMEETT